MKSMEDCITLWKDINLTVGIPFWISDFSGRELYAFPDNLSHVLDEELFPFCVSELKKHQIRKEVMIFYLTDSYYLTFCPIDDTCYMISAPLALEEHAALPFNFIQHFVRQEYKSRFISLLTSINAKPAFTAARFANLVRHAATGDMIGDVRIRDIRQERSHEGYSSDLGRIDSDDTLENSWSRNQSDYYEDTVSNAVKSGNFQEFVHAYHMPVNVQFGRMSSDALRQQKYLFIIQIYAISHAAIDSGVNPEIVFHMSDMYCLKMDSLNSMSEIKELILSAGREFCAKVREAKEIPEQSPEVSICCEYIFKHIYEPIQLKDLEKAAHMNRRSLTIHFKQEMGMTIPNYIMTKKLEEADFLLKASTFSILQISTILNFASESHFIQHFKKRYGITPKQYRQRNQERSC